MAETPGHSPDSKIRRGLFYDRQPGLPVRFFESTYLGKSADARHYGRWLLVYPDKTFPSSGLAPLLSHLILPSRAKIQVYSCGYSTTVLPGHELPLSRTRHWGVQSRGG